MRRDWRAARSRLSPSVRAPGPQWADLSAARPDCSGRDDRALSISRSHGETGMHDGQAQDTRGPKKPGRSGGAVRTLAIKYKDPRKLKPRVKNPRTHTPRQIKQI